MGTLSVDKILKTSQGAAEFTLPATDGTAGQVWQTDGSGQLSVGAYTIPADAVGASQIAAGAVGTTEIAALAVTASEIAATTITPAQMADSAFQANRNILINGDMQIAQRATSVTGSNFNAYTVMDRYGSTGNGSSRWTITQEADGPPGFGYSVKMLCTTAEDPFAAGNVLIAAQKIEGFNCQRMKKGTSSALSLTHSFWVKSNLTGTWVVEFDDRNNSRSVCVAYTISAADTWEYKTVTVPGDTTGALSNNNGWSFSISHWLGAGSTFSSGTLNTVWGARINANRAVGITNLAGTVNNYWQTTGWQLETSPSATPYDHKTVQQELAACQRYYQQYGGGPGSSADAENGTLVGRGNGTADLNNVLIPLPVIGIDERN